MIYRSNIYLVGFMGSGKSRQGQILASRIGRTFIDTDQVIIAEKSMSVNQIFEQHGEAFFRDLELETVREISEVEELVVALGGGTPTIEAVWPLLKNTGKTVYIKRSPEQILRQLHRYDNRPLLKHLRRSEAPEFVRKMLAERTQFYDRADMILDCQDGWDKDETSKALQNLLEKNL